MDFRNLIPIDDSTQHADSAGDPPRLNSVSKQTEPPREAGKPDLRGYRIVGESAWSVEFF
jgi:hypothetical protein